MSGVPFSDDDRKGKRSHSLREAACSIVSQLQGRGHQALFAGGCVRDTLMGRQPSDYDVATSAPPETVIGLFKRTQKVGAAFGVVLVRIGRHSIEVATFRRDASYADGRHPTAVEFTDAREDATRRDFTINGIFLDPITGQVIDYVGGRADIEARLVRAIGEPSHRFAEDHLRLLRAIRFAARLDFQIEPATWRAMQEHAAHIAKISPERIREELEAILADQSRARGFQEMCASGLMNYLWPGSDLVAAQQERTLSTLRGLPSDARFELALAVLLSNLAPDQIAGVCDALRCSNLTKRRVAWLRRNQDSLLQPARLTLADLKLLMRNESFADLLSLFRARSLAGGDPLDAYEAIVARVNSIPPAEIAPPPLLTGHDLAEAGLVRGPRYREILDTVYYRQLNGEITSAEEAHLAARAMIDALESK